MKTDNVLLIVAVIVVLVSIIGAGITYSYINSLNSKLTGLATGWVNLTVESNLAVNFTYDTVDWGSGMVTIGQTDALLDTTNQSAENVTRGNWTGNHVGLVIENIGNGNVTLDLKSEYDNGTFIGGTDGSGPLFRWKIVSNDTAVSCKFSDAGLANNTWKDVNTSGSVGSRICDYFYFEDTRDQVRIDFFVRVPSDSITGARGNTITATIAGA